MPHVAAVHLGLVHLPRLVEVVRNLHGRLAAQLGIVVPGHE
ncbi:hypothetical protein ACFPRL_34230 [Pseudoclavibacter helvolus]